MLNPDVLMSARESSKVLSVFQGAVSNSVLYAWFREQTITEDVPELMSLINDSKILAVIGKSTEPLRGVLEESKICTGYVMLMSAARSSSLYRWLTNEFGSMAIVIDVRKSVLTRQIFFNIGGHFWILMNSRTHSSLHGLAETGSKALERSPIQVLSVMLLGAITGNTAIGLLFGSLDGTGLALRIGLVVMAVAGIQLDTPHRVLRESRIGNMFMKLRAPSSAVETDQQTSTLAASEYDDSSPASSVDNDGDHHG